MNGALPKARPAKNAFNDRIKRCPPPRLFISGHDVSASRASCENIAASRAVQNRKTK
jgi:hypothetical protein